MLNKNTISVFTGSRLVEIPEFVSKCLNEVPECRKEVLGTLFYADEARYSDAQVYVVLEQANKNSANSSGTGLFVLADNTKSFDERITTLLNLAKEEGLVAEGINVKEKGKVVKTFDPKDSKLYLYPRFNSTKNAIEYFNEDVIEISPAVIGKVKADDYSQLLFSEFLRGLGEMDKSHAEVYVIMEGMTELADSGYDLMGFMEKPSFHEFLVDDCLWEAEEKGLKVDGNNVLKDGKIVKSFTYNEKNKERLL